MTEDIPYLATLPPAAFPDNLRTFTHISNFLDPRFEHSGMFSDTGILRNRRACQSKRSSSTKTRKFPNLASI